MIMWRTMKGKVMKQLRFSLRFLLLPFLISIHFGSGAWAEGLTYQAVQVDSPQSLHLTAGESKIVETGVSFKRASVANPEISDQIVLSPKQIYLTGKAVGMTTLTLWGQDGKVANVFQIQVAPDISRLKEQLHNLLPNEPNLQVLSTHDHITLAGTVTNSQAVSKALVLAEPYAPKKVINMLGVGGVQQVMMEVKVAEMQRGLLRNLGVNFRRQQENHRDFSIGHLNNLTGTERNPITGDFEFIRSIMTNVVLGFGIGDDLWTIVMQMLKEHGLSRSLAEPTLITESGQPAEFLVGGEFPVPIPQQFSQVTINFKEFGVGLKFTPTVLDDGRISVVVNPEISELDFANSITLQGFVIPSLTTRRVRTVVELGDGQSFAIAGLLQENVRETVSKYPFLGDIPVLGALFRSSSFQKDETELIVIVTPHLVKPLDMVKQTLPTDFYLEPNDFEFMIMGYTEGVFPSGEVARPSEAYTLGQPQVAKRMPYRKGRMEGIFGHLAP
jgi:pilus assembly protein CpaC